jgi:hypothetical protein
MSEFPATVEVDRQPFTIQQPMPSENGESYQVLDAAGESLGAIEVDRRGQRVSCNDPTVQRVADEAMARGIIAFGKSG